MRLRLICLPALATLAALGAAQATRAAVPVPPDLAGEHFLALTANRNDEAGQVTLTTRTCDDNGGKVVFTASGPATGPYPGTFTESGTFVVEHLQNGSFAPVRSLQANFTIDSPVGQVTGTKTLDESIGFFDFAACLNDAFFRDYFIEAITFNVRYDARIRTATGLFSDRGLADFRSQNSRFSAASSLPGFEFARFEETFRTDGTAPVQVLPTAKDDCKDAAFATFVVFKNQGDCVSFVATGGANSPTGG